MRKHQHILLYGILLMAFSLSLSARPLAQVDYFYADDGTLVGKALNGKRVTFEYDLQQEKLME